MSKIVLDASALIALLREEPGAPLVEPVLDEALISAVNLSEVHAKLIERGAPNDEAWASLVDLDLEVAPFDDVQARRAAELREPTRQLGLSFGDRACLALAGWLELPVMTADRTWLAAPSGVEIRAIR